jgi:hypothetical protein
MSYYYLNVLRQKPLQNMIFCRAVDKKAYNKLCSCNLWGNFHLMQLSTNSAHELIQPKFADLGKFN